MKSLVKPTFASLLAMALLGAVVSAQAQTNATKSAEAPVKTKHEKKANSYYGTVASVDKTAKTVTLEGKEHQRVLEVTDATELTKDGKSIKLSDVVAGEYVTGSYKKTADGKMEAVKLNVGKKPEKKVEAPAAPATPATPPAPTVPTATH